MATTNIVPNQQEQKLSAAWIKSPTAVRLRSDTVALIKSVCPKSYSVDQFIFALVSRYGTTIHREALGQLREVIAKNQNQRGRGG